MERVVLTGDGLDATLFAAVWRALDAELERSTGYADLVQVNGFYRTPQGVTCKLALDSARELDVRWAALARVLGRAGVGESLTTRSLAAAWGLPPRKVRSFAGFLRTLGYEVRSRRTNPQLAAGHYLVPYPFPTLTKRSIQRHKLL